MNLLVMDSDEEDRKHFDYKEIVKTDNMSKKKLKKLKKKEKVIHLTASLHICIDFSDISSSELPK